ncbi:MAG: FkbM family methyltransferase [Candidatus Parvarchaeota archaeon]
MRLAKIISEYRTVYSNWFSVLYQMYRIRNKVKDKTNAMIKIRLRGKNDALNAPYHVVDSYVAAMTTSNPKIHNASIDNRLLFFSYDNYNLKFDLGNSDAFRGVFCDEEYNFLKVKGKDVLDIGANVGDTPIYFALKGAKKVIALEPYPYNFNLAQKNLQTFLTNYPEFKDKIEIINAGYGEDKIIKIDTSFIPDGCSDLRENENGPDINLYSLKTLVNKYNIVSGILKMDCEGCEYSLLNEDDEIIKKFFMIEIEYHYGYEKLVDKLRKCGYNIRYTEPHKFYNSSIGKMTIVGFIYAQQPVK